MMDDIVFYKETLEPTEIKKEVIKCKDCKYWKTVVNKYQISFGICTCGCIKLRNRDEFCNKGELRDESDVND